VPFFLLIFKAARQEKEGQEESWVRRTKWIGVKSNLAVEKRGEREGRGMQR